MEITITDAVTLERLAGYYEKNAAELVASFKKSPSQTCRPCPGGCGRGVPGWCSACPDCLHLVAAACRDAAGRVER